MKKIDKGFIDTVIDNAKEINKWHKYEHTTDYYYELGKLLADELYSHYDINLYHPTTVKELKRNF